jgi:hypothetical protein
MKARFAIGMSIVLVASALALAGEGSWTGYITDSKCAPRLPTRAQRNAPQNV